MKYKLSVIIPVYKTEKYLDICIQSVLEQELEDMQIILVDDESPDRAGEICNQYAEKYDNIVVIHKKNAGLGEARNSGIEMAQGKYLTFLDSDDYVAKDYYKEMYNTCEKYDVDICASCGFYRFTDDGDVSKSVYSKNIELIEQNNIKYLIPRLICNKPGYEDCIWGSVCFSFYRTKLLKNNNVKCISERQFISEDIWFSMDIYSCAHRVMISDIMGYYYRANPYSLSRGYNPERFQILEKTIKLFEDKCKKMNLIDWEKRVQLYFWGVFEKCINQEIQNKTKKEAIRNIKKMSSTDQSRHYIKNLANNKNFRGSHALLCRIIQKKQYCLLYYLISIYNRIKR